MRGYDIMAKKASTTDGFFTHQKEKSRIKTLIVTDFFKAYFPIINHAFKTDKIYYIDLFCGPGRYADGTPSTPLALLDVIDCFQSDDICNKLCIVLNDHDSTIISKLQDCIMAHPVIDKLRFKPQILNCEASKVDLHKYTEQQVPIFSFVDPWGYIDVSANQIWTLVKNAGSDCVLFFNADRILQDIGKSSQEEYFEQIFGPSLVQAREVQISSMSQRAKSEAFLKLFSKNLYDTMSKDKTMRFKLFVLPFCVEADDKEKTSHYIVFVSKAHKAISEMKNVMLKHSNYNSEILGFDSKDQFQVSLISREDNLNKSILSMIKSLLNRYPQFYREAFKVDTLMMRLDIVSMLESYQVMPYTLKEVKETIEYLHSKGCIQILIETNEKIKRPITYKREFNILKKIMEI